MARLNRLVLLLVTSLLIAAPSIAQDLSGHWEGEIQTPGQPLLVMVDLTSSDDGWEGTIDIPAQGAKELPLENVIVEGDSATFTIAGAPGSPTFEGKLQGSEIVGKFKQGPATLDFRLGRHAVERAKRPQEPEGPLPYDVREVTYENGDVTLAATITTPPGEGPFPAAVLITGSGAQDRDESLLGHKPFLVLADHLTRNGIVVLRADDRGVGGSTGDPRIATSEDYATDALASLLFLQQQPKVDLKKVGLVGHSEGGMIAPMVAARSEQVAFCVLLAGTGVPGSEILALQQRLILEANGAPKTMVEKLNELQKEAIAIAASDVDAETKKAGIADVMRQQNMLSPEAQRQSEEQLQQAIEAGARQFLSPWFQFFLNFDPRSALAKTTVPVLAINGSLDLQVDAEQNLPAIEKALQEAGNEDVTVETFESLNHLFQTARTGSPVEYGQIEETFAPVALQRVSSWIVERFASK
ncbi:MAG: alpha/beta fold hydrolase [Acidobacteriota bacterium]